MSAATLKAGRSGALQTSVRFSNSDRLSATVTVKGPFAVLKTAHAGGFVPAGYTLESSNVSPDGSGLGELTVNCTKYDAGDGTGFSPVLTVFRVEMQEVQYDLEDHPHLSGERDVILKWLATDESKRVDGNTYRYQDEEGELRQVTGQLAISFCKAYMAGIKTFCRYYPVIEKESTWKNPPGLNMSGRSFSGGSPTFSSGIGRYNDPPISLSGYGSGHWFKSKDSWVRSENKTWKRTEQWTYTPEPSSGEHAWIYQNI